MKRCLEASSVFAETQPPSGEKSLSMVRTVCAVDALPAKLVHESGQARDVVGRGGGTRDHGEAAMLMLQQCLGGHDAALHVIRGKTLLAQAAENSIEQHDVRLMTAQGHDVFFEQRVAQHDQAIAAAVDQELHALDRLAPLIGGAMPESDHHVASARPQLGIDRLQDRGVEGTLQDRDVDSDHLRRA